jgi:hypothetical protein
MFVLTDQQPVDRRHKIVKLRLGDVLARFPAERIPEFIDDLSGQSQVVVSHVRFSAKQVLDAVSYQLLHGTVGIASWHADRDSRKDGGFTPRRSTSPIVATALATP